MTTQTQLEPAFAPFRRDLVPSLNCTAVFVLIAIHGFMDIQHLTAPLNVISLGRAGGDELSTERAGHPADAGHHLLLHPRQPPRCPQRSPCQSASQALQHLVAGTRGHRPPRLLDCHAWRRLPAGESALFSTVFFNFPLSS